MTCVAGLTEQDLGVSGTYGEQGVRSEEVEEMIQVEGEDQTERKQEEQEQQQV